MIISGRYPWLCVDFPAEPRKFRHVIFMSKNGVPLFKYQFRFSLSALKSNELFKIPPPPLTYFIDQAVSLLPHCSVSHFTGVVESLPNRQHLTRFHRFRRFFPRCPLEYVHIALFYITRISGG
eukprot:GHVU01187852.1.p1 GENE.GHVU01187852.1~~GHVU01187852.1.p1  ORF type:complete len:123 (+),score=4.30 GHVU01187852.1:194-562(+)